MARARQQAAKKENTDCKEKRISPAQMGYIMYVLFCIVHLRFFCCLSNRQPPTKKKGNSYFSCCLEFFFSLLDSNLVDSPSMDYIPFFFLLYKNTGREKSMYWTYTGRSTYCGFFIFFFYYVCYAIEFEVFCFIGFYVEPAILPGP